MSAIPFLTYFVIAFILHCILGEPPTYVESLTGAVDIRDEDDDTQGTMGDLTYTPMYTYVYDYRYRPPPAYSEVLISIRFLWFPWHNKKNHAKHYFRKVHFQKLNLRLFMKNTS